MRLFAEERAAYCFRGPCKCTYLLTYFLTYLLTNLLVNIRPYVAGRNLRYNLQFERNTSPLRQKSPARFLSF